MHLVVEVCSAGEVRPLVLCSLLQVPAADQSAAKCSHPQAVLVLSQVEDQAVPSVAGKSLPQQLLKESAWRCWLAARAAQATASPAPALYLCQVVVVVVAALDQVLGHLKPLVALVEVDPCL